MNGDLGDQSKSLLLCRKLVIRKEVLSMGLISEHTKIKISGRNVKYFKGLGYEIPQKPNGRFDLGQDIIVKVSDLTYGSHAIVEIECDCCLKHIERQYGVYNKINHDGKYYCSDCATTVLNSGENHRNWNPNITDEERENGRNYPEYTEFIKSVLARDNYTCRCCGKKYSKEMEVHHLYGYAGFPKYRLDQTQALTLCKICHKAFHNWHTQEYGYENRGKNTREQYEAWYGKAVQDLKEYNGELPTTRQIYCFETNIVYNSVSEACQSLNIPKCTENSIYKVCNLNNSTKSVYGYHLLYYSDYIKMNDEELSRHLEYCSAHNAYRKTICLETLEVFDTLTDAIRHYNKTVGKNTHISTFISACKSTKRTAFGLHWMYYDEYLKQKEQGFDIYNFSNDRDRSIICLTTNKIFNRVKDSADFYNVLSCDITKTCRKIYKSAGKLEDGTPLYWMYYDEYLSKINNGEKIELPKREHYRKMVVCITTGKIFDYIKDGANYYGFHPMGITSQLKGKSKTAGKLPDGTPLKWMYYSDFLNLPQNKQEEILNRNKDSSIIDRSFIM